MKSGIAKLITAMVLSAMLAVAGGAAALAAPDDPAKAIAAAQPKPGTSQYQGDWAVGCDNLLRCEAIALLPEPVGQDEPLLLHLIRAGGPGGEVELRISALSMLPDSIVMVADNREVLQWRTGGSDDAVVRGETALAAAQSLPDAVTIRIVSGERRKRDRRTLALISTAGLVDALRFIDTRQGRIGTRSALTQRGGDADTGVPAAPPRPIVTQRNSPAADSATPLEPREIAEARKLAMCDARAEADGAVELFPLDAGSALLLLPCEGGAYNVSAVPLIASGVAGARTLALARFDFAPGFTGPPDKPPLVVNALWDARRGILSSLAKGRGIGDCGASESYVWDGARFRLVESRAMQVCRGAWEWIRLWDAGTQGGAKGDGA